jgi:ribonuclease HII
MSNFLIGIDEAGRGCMAGHMYISAVSLDVKMHIPGLKDSKKLTEAQREDLVDPIWTLSAWYETLSTSPEQIDREGLGVEWRRLVRVLVGHAKQKFGIAPVVIDGNVGTGDSWVKPVVKADNIFACVKAASILAKYAQTCFMDKYHDVYPMYGFDKHRGYVTQKHKAAVEEFGPCPIHRMSYDPIKKIVAKRSSMSCG